MGKSLVSCFFETQCYIYIRQLTRKYLQSSSCFNNAENSAGENWQRRLCVGLAVRSLCLHAHAVDLPEILWDSVVQLVTL